MVTLAIAVAALPILVALAIVILRSLEWLGARRRERWKCPECHRMFGPQSDVRVYPKRLVNLAPGSKIRLPDQGEYVLHCKACNRDFNLSLMGRVIPDVRGP